MGHLLDNIAKTLSAAIVVLTFLAYLCPFVDPEAFPWLSFFGTAFPWVMLLNALFAVGWMWRRNRFWLYHVGILMVGWSYVSSFVGLNFGQSTVPENAISVATHNIGGIYRNHKRITRDIQEKTVSRYARFLQENGFPDVLCTQETTGGFYRLLAAKLGYEHTFNLKKGTVIYSRFPMEAGGDIPFGKTYNSTIWVDIRTPDGKLVRVYNVHLQSNKVTTDTEKVIEEGEFKGEQTWGEIGDILEKVGGATRVRAQQAKLLRDHIAACPHPAIVCGDFNDTPNSYVYRLVSENMRDTFRERGLGFGSTFAGALPFLRIDYVLTNRKIKTFACHRARVDMSDHYPVFAEIGF